MFDFLGKFSFGNIAALSTLAAASIPVLIHLFNRSRGKLVIVGSLQLIRDVKSKRITEIKLKQYLLLAIRVTLLILAGLLAADLSKSAYLNVKKEVTYITPLWLSLANDAERYKLQSDMSDGEAYIVADGFPRLDLTGLRSASNDFISPDTPNTDVSTLLLGHLTSRKHLAPIQVYSAGLAAELIHFNALSQFPIDWHFTSGTTALKYETPKLSIALVSETTTASRLGLVAQALRRIGEVRKIELLVEILTPAMLQAQPQPQRSIDWIFWFRSSANSSLPPLSFDSDTKVLIFPEAEQPGSPVNATLDEFPFTRFSARLADRGNIDGDWIGKWSTDNGTNLLGVGVIAGRNVYRLEFDPFSPRDGMAEQPAFPVILMDLLVTHAENRMRYPSAKVVTPPLAAPAPDPQVWFDHYPPQSLTTLLAALIALLWFAERWLSERARYA